MSVETVLETIVVSQIIREAGAPETVVEQLVRTEVVTETSGRPGKPGVSVVNVVAAQASDGTVTLTFTMSDGETHVVTFQAGTGGAPAVPVELAGHAVGRGAAGAALSAVLNLSGVAAASARATAPIGNELALTGAATGRATASGGLVASLALTGTAAGRASAAGQASIALDLAGTAVGRAQASATLTIGDEIALRGTAIGRGAATTAAILDLAIAGAATGRAAASGALTAALDVTGTATGRASAVGALAASVALAGAATGQGRASGAATLTAPSAFNVLALGPSMWIDAADAGSLSIVDGKVSQASDKSGNGRHAVQATAARQPSYAASHPVANNKPAIFAEGANTQVILSTESAFAVAEWYIVAAYMTGTEATSGNFQALMGGSGTSGQPRLLTSSGTANWITSNAMANGSVSKNGAAESIVTLPMPLSLVRAVDTAANATANYRRFVLNQAEGQSRSWPGPVCEIIGFQAALAASDREALITHLKAKWGLVF